MVFWFNEDIKHQWEVLSSMYNFSPFPILPRIHPWLTVAMLSSLMQYHHIILHHNSCFGPSHNVGSCLIACVNEKYFSRQPRRPLRWLQLRGGSGGCGAAAALRPRVRVRHPVQGGEHPGHDDAEMLRRKMPWCRWAPTSRASWRASSRTTTRPSAPPTPTVSLPL